MIDAKQLVRKYNHATPRYTSYPTLPHWKNSLDSTKWQDLLKESFELNNGEGGISIYIHLPYCESLCTYCGCSKRITKKHSVETPYLEAVLKEWSLYKAFFPHKPNLKELHLGGGTPTFFSPEHLEKLVATIVADCETDESLELSVEAHPNSTSEAHLEVFKKLNFKRISYGIQDFDTEVQRVINRYQSVEEVADITNLTRQYGIESINYDLVYGLPLQTLAGLKTTLEAVIEMLPDRIAFYSYAHVPWTAKGQRLYSEIDLPAADVKLQMNELGRTMLMEAGYKDIGMDHFALAHDSMSIATDENRLHRNFMGYTTNTTKVLVGLGVSSISDIYSAYGQNVKTIEEYKQKLARNEFPVVKGHVLSIEEQNTRLLINALMCHAKTEMPQGFFDELSQMNQNVLLEMEKDNLLVINVDSIEMTDSGKRFVRNVCALIDPYLQGDKSEVKQFSQAV